MLLAKCTFSSFPGSIPRATFPFTNLIAANNHHAMNDDPSVIQQRGKKTRVIASSNTWIEGEAIRQLQAVAEWPGVREIVGMPDLHPGKGSPIGAAMISDLIYAGMVGSDIGCGMRLYTTDLKAPKAKPLKIAALLDGLDRPWEGDPSTWLSQIYNVPATAFDASLGTPGHSNHFIEVQRVLEVRDEARFTALGMDADHLCVLVHSGSRGFGESILYDITERHGATGIACDSPDGIAYQHAHDHAVRWAVANRALCAHRALEALGADGRLILDICHNSITSYALDECNCWLHRKGAAPTDQGPIVIPGSRGDVSFLVHPKTSPISLHSVAHGAGRKIARGVAKGKLEHRYNVNDLQQNRWGGRVVCGERQLLWEEAPECYKDATSVVNDLVHADLVDIIAILHPLVTFKTSEGARVESKRHKENWQRDRQIARAAKRQR
jgi:release factor H-coupled RctB family protein